MRRRVAEPGLRRAGRRRGHDATIMARRFTSPHRMHRHDVPPLICSICSRRLLGRRSARSRRGGAGCGGIGPLYASGPRRARRRAAGRDSGRRPRGGRAQPLADVMVVPDEVDALVGLSRGSPARRDSARSCCSAGRSERTARGLVANRPSTGPAVRSEFAAWRQGRPSDRGPTRTVTPLVEREGERLDVVLDRPEVATRSTCASGRAYDALTSACTVPIRSVHPRGNRPDFCAAVTSTSSGRDPIGHGPSSARRSVAA